MGETAADLTAKILNGEEAGSLPVVLPQPQLIMSRAAAAHHGVPLPTDIRLLLRP
jgi:ABC-type uncharacterized transport system substrate-binding protein